MLGRRIPTPTALNGGYAAAATRQNHFTFLWLLLPSAIAFRRWWQWPLTRHLCPIYRFIQLWYRRRNRFFFRSRSSSHAIPCGGKVFFATTTPYSADWVRTETQNNLLYCFVFVWWLGLIFFCLQSVDDFSLFCCFIQHFSDMSCQVKSLFHSFEQ